MPSIPSDGTMNTGRSADVHGQQWLADLLARPDLFLRELDLGRDRARFLPMTEASYRASSFLDGRAVRTGTQEAAAPLGALVMHLARLDPPRRPLHCLFHIGHCGSTLLSRLLGELPGFMSLREPPPLLMLAQLLRFLDRPGMQLTQAQWQQLFDLVVRLLSRTYRDGDIAVVKPMSHTNNLMPQLLHWHPQCRGIFLYVDLETCLASMLQAKNRGETARAVQESRWPDYLRLVGAGDQSPAELGDGELAALVWLVQMTEYEHARTPEDLDRRLLPIHFDEFLEAPAEKLAAVAGFLGHPAPSDRIDAVLDGPMMRSYSKAPGTAFSAGDRSRELAAVAAQCAVEIGRGIAWVQQQAQRHPTFASVLARYGRRT